VGKETSSLWGVSNIQDVGCDEKEKGKLGRAKREGGGGGGELLKLGRSGKLMASAWNFGPVTF